MVNEITINSEKLSIMIVHISALSICYFGPYSEVLDKTIYMIYVVLNAHCYMKTFLYNLTSP